MPRFRVVLTDMIEDDLLPERDVFGELAEIVTVKAKSEEDLFGHIEDADGLLVYLAPVSAASISRLKQCRVIVRCGVGYDNIDHKFARTDVKINAVYHLDTVVVNLDDVFEADTGCHCRVH